MFSLLVLSTWESVHLSVCLLSICTLGSMAAWHSSHVGLCLLLVLTIPDSDHIRSVFLGVCPTRFLSTWILSTWKPVHIIFCHLRIVSAIGCVHSTFCSLVVLSTWHYVYIGLFLIGILSTLDSVHLLLCRLYLCLLRSLATWNSAYVGLCPLLILSTPGSSHEWFFLLGSHSTWVFVYLDFVHLETCAHDILSIKDFVNNWLGPIWILLPLSSFYLGLCLYFRVQDFFLLGSYPICTLSTWFFLDFDSVYLGVCLHDILPM